MITAEILPAGVFNVITGDRDTGRTLVGHAGVDMVAITGSVRAGMQVAEEAIKSVKQGARARRQGTGRGVRRCRPGQGRRMAHVAGCFNAGQDCTAATRVLAQSGIHDDFAAALAEQAANTATTFENARRQGCPRAASEQREPDGKVLGFLERTLSHASIAAGGKRQATAALHRSHGRGR